jgi:hypothetical protein
MNDSEITAWECHTSACLRYPPSSFRSQWKEIIF